MPFATAARNDRRAGDKRAIGSGPIMAKILIVEAASVNRRMAAASLKDQGHDVIESSRGARGLKIAHSERPDLVLIDTLLPDMDGGQFVRAAFSTEPAPVSRRTNRWWIPRYVCGHHWKSSDELQSILRDAV